MSLAHKSNRPAPVLVAPLAAFDRHALDQAGGKGANLGELWRAGFRIPPGFVVTTAAYDLLLRENGLDPQTVGWLSGVEVTDPAAAASASRRIREALLGAAIPAAVSTAVLDAYRRMGGGAVAVRSSATAEDLPGAAFAGQQETFLNVVGEGALLEAVRGCWASLWSERAVLYRLRQNVQQAGVRLAVVVQRMAPADAAGVMFTANPVSGRRDEIVIDANPGLGEAVVGGLVTPDHYVVAKSSWRIQEQRLGKREVVVRPRAGGGIEQTAAGEAGQLKAALPAAAVRRLARLGARIERHYRAPQDIEWAWAGDGTAAGRFFILQARPVTALPEPALPEPAQAGGPMALIVPMLAEMWPERPYPLDMTTFTGAVEGAVGSLLASILGKSAPSPEGMFVEEDGVLVRFEPPEFHPSPGMLISPWLALWRTRRCDPTRWQDDPVLAEVVSRSQALDQIDLAGLAWEQNIEVLHEALALAPRALQLRERYLPNALVGLGVLWLLLRLARRGDRLAALLSGIETKTDETNRALERLALGIRSDPALLDLFAGRQAGELLPALETLPEGRAFQERFAAFLRQYGHREMSLTISQPAWKDRPETVLGILKALAPAPPHSQESERLPAWERARDDLLSGSILGSRLLRGLFLKSLAYGRAFFQIREDTHFYATLVQPVVRGVALELGRRLARAGALPSPEDVFHLRLEDLEALGEGWPPSGEALDRTRLLAARRKAKRESLAAQPVFDPRLLAAGSPQGAGEGVLLAGSPGSPGLAQGPARVVRDSSEFGKLQPGDVLVAPVTNPAWTPLFLRAAAVVVDTGGAASHAAIVAREYGIPAVMGVGNGTALLHDGQVIRVDGSRGVVLKVGDEITRGPE